MKKHEIRLSGSGGQGVILASIILADAAIEQGLANEFQFFLSSQKNRN